MEKRMPSLSNKTIIITGSSRGIGRAMALRFARDGANIVIAAKSAEPHPKLKGTIFDVALEVETAGGQALPIQVDVRSEDQITAMVQAAAKKFGRIDALINNAGAISLTNVAATPPKRYDLMQNINARAVFLCSQAVLPYLKSSPHPHILSLSPPLNLDLKWFKDFAPYTVSKYGMTMLTLGMAQEFSEYNIAVNCLWPRTAIATAAIEFAVGNREFFKHCRTTDILADAAYELLTTKDCSITGQTLLDEDFLAQRGYTDFAKYAYDPDHANGLMPDFFLD
jgi:citronellol/citronellal dehydrogenase